MTRRRGSEEKLLTPSLCKAARALVGLTQRELAKAAKIGVSILADFEREAHEPRPHNLSALRRALERAGVEFIAENGGGPGVRLAKRRGKAKR